MRKIFKQPRPIHWKIQEKKVFEPYFTTKEFGAGNGMGLAVVYGLMKKCKGAIVVNSALGQGDRNQRVCHETSG